MQTYTHYKESGIDWIGQIPEHWEVKRLKHVIKARAGFAFPSYHFGLSTNDGIPVVRISDLDSDGIVKLDKCPKLPFTYSCYLDNYGLKEGDILFAMTGGTIGKTAIYSSSLKSLLNQRVCSITIDNLVLRKIIHYWLISNYWKNFININSSGGAQPNISDITVLNLKIAIPPIHEQEAIANFLDEKTAKIDALVHTKEQQIEKLKELRQAKIHQAVTKGLDASAPTKDSGVEWIGEIPEHWEVSKVKNYLKIPITDGPHTTPILLDEGIPFISAEAIKNGKIDFNKKRGNISEEDYKLFSQKYVPQRNDIYMIKSGATTGNIAMVETDDIFTIWSPLAVFRSNHRILPKFLYNILQSSYFKTSVELSWSFGTQQNIGMGVLSNLYITIPISLKEQEQIVAYLDEVTGKINQAIAQKQEQITKLKEYKQSLINNVVTGKVKVC